MKKHLYAVAATVLLAGCSNIDYYNNNRETRYFAYVGEPVAVLYDNFGTPAKGIKYNATERALVFHTQDFEREWAFTDYRYCDITFYLTNDIVTGWQMDGNQCAINEEYTGFWDSVFGSGNTSGGSTAAGIADDAFGGASISPDAFMIDAEFGNGFTGGGNLEMFDLGEEFSFTTPDMRFDTYQTPSTYDHYTAPVDTPQGHVIADDAF